MSQLWKAKDLISALIKNISQNRLKNQVEIFVCKLR